MANASLKTAETDALKICMIQRGLTVEGLADDCGVETVTLSNQIAKNFPSRRLRLVIEDVLGLPIWSRVTEFESRQALTSKCGYDPFVLSTMKLRQGAAELRIRGRSKDRHKDGLIKLIQHHFSDTKNRPFHTTEMKNPQPVK